MTYDEWVEKFKPQHNHILGENNAPIDGYMYETYGEEYEFVKTKLHNLWTVVTGEGDHGELYLLPGFHWVNVLGYIVTEEMYDDTIEDILID